MFNTTKFQKWKQITTLWIINVFDAQLCSILRNFKNESKSQLKVSYFNCGGVVFNTTKFQKWKQITTWAMDCGVGLRCVQYYEISKMKANHNLSCSLHSMARVVFNTTKFQKWKQITTSYQRLWWDCELCSILRNFKNESKSQLLSAPVKFRAVVFNTTKFQKWKQITTLWPHFYARFWLCSILRNFKNESKSQLRGCNKKSGCVVFNTTKFQKWKQITTEAPAENWAECCVQYYEISKMKANHN